LHDSTSSAYALIAWSTNKITGSGSQGFVQNHPYDASKVIVYSALEGGEVGTYTRGTARIENGEARIALGATFAWVTNPDIGLTAQVTPRSRPADLYVAEVGTAELVVRSDDYADEGLVFDYLVHGLRIGFEETTVVQPKRQESYIPSMEDHRAMLTADASLASYTAISRFRDMMREVHGVSSDTLDLSRAERLRAAVHEYDAVTDPPVDKLLGHGPTARVGSEAPGPRQAPAARVQSEVDEDRLPPSAVSTEFLETGRIVDGVDQGDEACRNQDLLFPVARAVERGELLSFDPEQPDRLVASDLAQDPALVGIAAEASETLEGVLMVRLVDKNYAVVKADAGYGGIRRGDLLTTSPTGGHAMRATEIIPGTILGKALEPLDTGTGLIRVLVTLR
jgi:hypothetical protein